MEIIKLFQVFLLFIANVYGKVRNDCVCGIMNAAYGTPGSTGSKYSWMVSLMTIKQEGFCGGALISDQHVLTAGTCVIFDTASPRFWRDIIGKVPEADLFSGHGMNFDAVHLHPNLIQSGSFDSNLAILKFVDPLASIFGTFSPNRILPICIPQINLPNIHKRAIVIGFGTSDNNVQVSQGLLREDVVQIVSPSQCPNPANKKIFLTNSLICGQKLGIDQCPHDLGSPLFVKSAPNNFELIGITTIPDTCGSTNARIYVDISKSVPWIWKVINQQASAGYCPRTLLSARANLRRWG